MSNIQKTGFEITDFPKNMQLYARDRIKKCGRVTIAGTFWLDSGYEKYRISVCDKPGNLVDLDFYLKKAEFREYVDISPALKNYKFQLHGVKSNGDEILLREADKVVAGDVYIIQGQSNAEAHIRDRLESSKNDENEFLRVYGSGNDKSYPAEWFKGQGDGDNNSDGNVGQWGLYMGNKLIQETGIPIAIFNGAEGGKKISHFHKNGSTGIKAESRVNMGSNYGRLLQRLIDTNLRYGVKAIFWNQGESNAGDSTNSYLESWWNLYENWKVDFPNVEKIYVMQIRLRSGEKGLSIQEALRQLAMGRKKEAMEAMREEEKKQVEEQVEMTEIISLSSADLLVEKDGNKRHYAYSQYKKFGKWACQYLLRDIYYDVYDKDLFVEPPQVTKAIINKERKEITLHMKNHKDYALTSIGDFYKNFREVQGGHKFVGGYIKDNNIVLKFDKSENINAIYFKDFNPVVIKDMIVNQTGMGLVFFYDLDVKEES